MIKSKKKEMRLFLLSLLVLIIVGSLLLLMGYITQTTFNHFISIKNNITLLEGIWLYAYLRLVTYTYKKVDK